MTTDDERMERLLKQSLLPTSTQPGATLQRDLWPVMLERLDETSGALCPTYTAVSGFRELGAAVENLRTREGMPSTKGVGFINPESGSQSNTSLQRHPTAVEQIRAWSNTHGRPAVIWTALASNFHEPAKANKHFSVEAAIRYLETCDPKTLASALAYIHQTPPEIQTPLRTAIGERWPRKE